jgi:hypothetical protein
MELTQFHSGAYKRTHSQTQEIEGYIKRKPFPQTFKLNNGHLILTIIHNSIVLHYLQWLLGESETDLKFEKHTTINKYNAPPQKEKAYCTYSLSR